MAELIGQENFSNAQKYTQVYQATHDGAGTRLPYMGRSFISFTFGGKAIEDFGLIVVNSGDRMERAAYAPFADLTSTYDTLNGQLYWGTHFEAKQLELDLATDGITERQLDDFREWFSPGKERELILSEHPNRAILARIAEPPNFSLLPFEEKITFLGKETSTTMYRGEVHINFIMDEPFWYGKLNYMPTYIDKITLEGKKSPSEAGNNIINALEDKDMLKIMLEDNIPHQSVLSMDMFLGENLLIVQEARVNVTRLDRNAFLGKTTGSSDGLEINNNFRYLFYSGTAPSYPIIKFTLPLEFENDYIKTPANKIQNPNLQNDNYSYIAIDDKKFYFTTPSILTAYNTAIQIFSSISSDKNKVTLLEEIKEKVHEYYARAWAVKCVNSIDFPEENDPQKDEKIQNIKDNLKTNMGDFFENNPEVTFIINSKTGEAIGRFKVNTGSVHEEIEQNVGDMIRSDYLIIEGRNYLNSDGGITENNCKVITSNEHLENVLIFYQNMYL